MVSGIIAFYYILVKWKIRLLMPSLAGIVGAIRKSADVFLNNLMPNLYNSFSTVLLGVWGGDISTGILDAGTKFVNIAKTQFSFTGDKSVLGAPDNFTLKVTDIEIRSGAKMIVAIAGNMLLMPGLGKNSNYLNMHINSDGSVEGLM